MRPGFNLQGRFLISNFYTYDSPLRADVLAPRRPQSEAHRGVHSVHPGRLHPPPAAAPPGAAATEDSRDPKRGRGSRIRVGVEYSVCELQGLVVCVGQDQADRLPHRVHVSGIKK